MLIISRLFRAAFPRLTARRTYAAAYRSYYRSAHGLGISRETVASARRCAMRSALRTLQRSGSGRAYRVLMARALHPTDLRRVSLMRALLIRCAA